MSENEQPRFCKVCDYSLRGVSGGACPECGRGFDAGDARTFSARPRARVRRWARRVGIVIAVVGVIVVLAEVFGPSRVARITWAWPNGDGATATWETKWCLVGPRWMGARYPRWTGERGTKGIERRGLVYCEYQMWEVRWFGVERGILAAFAVPGKLGKDGVVRSTSGVPVARPGFEMYFDVGPVNLDALCDEVLRPSTGDVPSMHMLPSRKAAPVVPLD